MTPTAGAGVPDDAYDDHLGLYWRLLISLVIGFSLVSSAFCGRNRAEAMQIAQQKGWL